MNITDEKENRWHSSNKNEILFYNKNLNLEKPCF